MLLKDKVVLVVGSTSGIGKSIAEIAAQEGATVILTGRRVEKGEAVAKGIADAGGKAEFMKMDALDLPGCYDAIDNLLAKHGKLDVLFYNAGIAPSPVQIDNATEAQWDAIVGTNLRSAFFLLQKVLPELEKVGGNVVYTSSSAAFCNGGGEVVYGSSKAGLNHMVQMLAHSLAKRNVRVNAVAPGPTKTDIFAGLDDATLKQLGAMLDPMGVVLDPEDLANAAVFLASDKARYITGQILGVDAGASLS